MEKIEIAKLVGCARCGGHHEGLTAKPFEMPMDWMSTEKNDRYRFTHWTMCPVTNEPILVTSEGNYKLDKDQIRYHCLVRFNTEKGNWRLIFTDTSENVLCDGVIIEGARAMTTSNMEKGSIKHYFLVEYTEYVWSKHMKTITFR